MAIKAFGKSLVSYDTWAALTEYSLADKVTASIPGDKYYECTTAGTSGLTEPSWDSVPGHTTRDEGGTPEEPTLVIWTCRETPYGANPLTVILDTTGQGGLGLIELWVKSDVECEFLIYGSHDGKAGTWRLTDAIDIPTNKGKTEKHDGYFNAYHFVKVFVDGAGNHEIEIVAGEM